jgi:hypothetical protein
LSRTNTGVSCSDWAALMPPRFLLTSDQLSHVSITTSGFCYFWDAILVRLFPLMMGT